MNEIHNLAARKAANDRKIAPVLSTSYSMFDVTGEVRNTDMYMHAWVGLPGWPVDRVCYMNQVAVHVTITAYTM